MHQLGGIGAGVGPHPGALKRGMAIDDLIHGPHRGEGSEVRRPHVCGQPQRRWSLPLSDWVLRIRDTPIRAATAQ